MNDRELLELAAKAAGIDVYESTDGTIQNRPVLVFSAGGAMGTMPYEERWNPLADSAQAFQLAVKLKLNVDLAYEEECVVRVFSDKHFFSESTAQYPYAASRRAIVRAAAEIGKEMP